MSTSGFHLPSASYSRSTMSQPITQVKLAVKDVKDFLSVKNTETKPLRRLEPVQGVQAHSSLSSANTLPPIGSKPKSTPQVPSISSTEPPDTPTEPSVPPIESSITPTALSASSPEPSAPSADEEQSLPSSTVHHPDALPTVKAPPSATTVDVNANTVVSNTDPFATSQTRSQHQDGASVRHSTAGLLDAANQPDSRASRIKEQGIRTYPALAVCSVFLCCPIFGLCAAILTLKAENSFYEKEYVLAHREGFVARICLLLAVISGVIIVVSVVAYIYATP
ncbi:uncharacterized protein [Watersipora subatra]|uniref:uncharacterized protein isoform X2 n=1 Tax=Watersipora subatra TaxID=2589382 RepID=UPI00355C0F00